LPVTKLVPVRVYRPREKKRRADGDDMNDRRDPTCDDCGRSRKRGPRRCSRITCGSDWPNRMNDCATSAAATLRRRSSFSTPGGSREATARRADTLQPIRTNGSIRRDCNHRSKAAQLAAAFLNDPLVINSQCIVGLTTTGDRRRDSRHCRRSGLGPIPDSSTAAICDLFDHLVGAHKERFRNGETKRFGGSHVHD
jgi:hypothetical protein